YDKKKLPEYSNKLTTITNAHFVLNTIPNVYKLLELEESSRKLCDLREGLAHEHPSSFIESVSSRVLR
ncbi:2261_t:CDS:2, partial [Dentiscutata heterogama]